MEQTRKEMLTEIVKIMEQLPEAALVATFVKGG